MFNFLSTSKTVQPASSIFQVSTLRGAAIRLGSQPYQALLVDVDLGESVAACALLVDLGSVFWVPKKSIRDI